jgi:mRNA-degrading endonuclease RelE of RelBE toxin-antitoxin system
VIRIFLGNRLLRSLGKLDPGVREKVETALSEVSQNFGDPHRHGGLGLRKLSPGLWECRLGIQLRIVFLQEKDRLIAYDIMNHDEVRAWLKRAK